MKKIIWKYIFLIGVGTFLYHMLQDNDLSQRLENNQWQPSLLSEYPVLKVILFILIIAISIYNIRRDIRCHKENTK